MKCPKCSGLAVYHELCDHVTSHSTLSWRCLLCGNIVDKVIQDNRVASLPEQVHVPQIKKDKEMFPAHPCGECGEPTQNEFSCSKKCSGARWSKVRTSSGNRNWGSGGLVQRVY